MEAFRIFNEELGVKTNRNPYLQSKGTLVSCENIETVRQNIYRKCRGRKAYGTALSNSIKQFLKYKNRLLVHDTSNLLWYDSDGAGTFVKYYDDSSTDVFNNIDSTYLLEGLEAKSNLYINTQSGVYKIDKLDGTFTKSGVSRGLGADIRAEVVAGSWLADSYVCRYRFIWTYIDNNGNKIIGAPSDYESFTNNTGSSTDLSLDIYIPQGITTDHQLEAYRTQSLDSSTNPTPTDYQLVYQTSPSSADITAGYITIKDIVPDGFRGASLYTNATQQGESEANERPPYCKTMDLFKGYAFYANTKLYQELQTALVGLPTSTFDIKISNGTTTKTLGSMLELVDGGTGLHLTSTVLTIISGTGGKIRIKTTAAHQLSNGDWVKITGVVGLAAANGRFEVSGISADEFDLEGTTYGAGYSSGGTVELYEDIGTTPRFIIYRDSGSTTAQLIDKTARSIVRTINLTTAWTYWEATYTSVDTEAVGKIKIRTKGLSDAAFYLQVGTNGQLYFSPKIPLTSSTDYSYVSTAVTNINGLMYSKYEEVEHVPSGHLLLVGRSDDKILDIIASKNSLWIIKENDGVFKLTGSSPSDWVLEEYDSTIKCLQRNSIAKGGNNIYMMSNYGYIRLGDAGTDLIGDDNFSHDIKPIFNTDYEYDGYGFFYETEKSYFASTHELTTSTDNDIVKVYNALTNSWSLRRHGVYANDTSVRCGIVINDIMYTAPLTGGQILIERKDFQTTDYKSPDVSITISSIDTTTGRITLSAATILPEESLITQGTNTTRITSRISNVIYEVVSVSGLSAGVATVSVGIESKVKYHKIHCGYPETEKSFEKITVFFDDDETSIRNLIVRTNSDHYKTTEDTNIINTGVPWGTIEWGSLWGGVAYTDRFITFIPQNHTTGCYLYVELIHRRSGENCALAGLSIVFEPIDQQFRR